MKNYIFTVLCLLFPVVSGFSQEFPYKLVDPNATIETKALFYNLKTNKQNGIMFGHQDDMSYGLGWKNEDSRSDVKDVCGSFPAVSGWDLGEIGQPFNIDSVSFDRMKFWIRSVFERGGINTISMHIDNPVSGGSAWETTEAVKHILPGGHKHEAFTKTLELVAGFINDLKSKNGQPIPVIFRPYHEHTGKWFWWGKSHCTPEEYRALWRYTVEYLRDKKGLHNILYAYSPDRFETQEEYLERYPGDNYIDMMGFDDYWDFKSVASAPKGVEQIRIVVKLADEHGKIPALTETGLEGLPNENWFTTVLLNPIKADTVARRIAYFLVWRNYSVKHHYAPYPGEKAVSDFLKFYNDPITIFEKDLPNMYVMP